jgi:hypothetical protein
MKQPARSNQQIDPGLNTVLLVADTVDRDIEALVQRMQELEEELTDLKEEHAAQLEFRAAALRLKTVQEKRRRR